MVLRRPTGNFNNKMEFGGESSKLQCNHQKVKEKTITSTSAQNGVWWNEPQTVIQPPGSREKIITPTSTQNGVLWTEP